MSRCSELFMMFEMPAFTVFPEGKCNEHATINHIVQNVKEINVISRTDAN